MPATTGLTPLGAIENALVGNAAVLAAVDETNNVPNIWSLQMPEKRTFPGIVILHGGERPNWTSEVNYWEEGIFKIVCLAYTAAVSEAIGELVKAALDQDSYGQPAIAITNAQSMSFLRISKEVMPFEERGPSGEIVVQTVLTYQLRVSYMLAG